MIKNFFSNALLSLVMDKQARTKLKVMRDNKRGKRSASQSLASPEDTTSSNVPPKNIVKQPELDREQTRALIAETLDAAQKELESTPKLSKTLDAAQHELENKPKISNERQALIQNALSIQKTQSKLLEDLDKEQKEKLQHLALMAFSNDKSS